MCIEVQHYDALTCCQGDQVASKCRVSVNLTSAEHSALMGFAQKYEVSMSWLARQAIGEFLARYRDEEFQLPLQLKPSGARERNL